MKFKDLPNWSETLIKYHQYYTQSKHTRVYLIHKDESRKDFKGSYAPELHDTYHGVVSSHASFFRAYLFLKQNPELEVCDDFFGNNFPFIAGLIKPIGPDGTNGILIFTLHALSKSRVDFSKMILDKIIVHSTEYVSESLYPNCKENEFMLNSGNYDWVAISTHAELIDALNVARIMSL